jgi:hypothetical protein
VGKGISCMFFSLVYFRRRHCQNQPRAARRCEGAGDLKGPWSLRIRAQKYLEVAE